MRPSTPGLRASSHILDLTTCGGIWWETWNASQRALELHLQGRHGHKVKVCSLACSGELSHLCVAPGDPALLRAGSRRPWGS